MKTIVEIEWNSNKPLRELNISVALQTYFTGECFTVREIPAQMEGEENDSTKAFRRALEEIKTGLKNAGFKRTVAEIQALLDDYPVIQQPIPAKVDDKNLCECGKPASEHHEFRRQGCKCRYINQKLSSICNSFLPESEPSLYCKECGHHKSCHAQGK